MNLRPPGPQPGDGGYADPCAPVSPGFSRAELLSVALSLRPPMRPSASPGTRSSATIACVKSAALTSPSQFPPCPHEPDVAVRTVRRASGAGAARASPRAPDVQIVPARSPSPPRSRSIPPTSVQSDAMPSSSASALIRFGRRVGPGLEPGTEPQDEYVVEAHAAVVADRRGGLLMKSSRPVTSGPRRGLRAGGTRGWRSGPRPRPARSACRWRWS